MTATWIPGSQAHHAFACSVTSSMMCSPSETIKPVSSASGMNSSGPSSPQVVAPANERLDAAPPALAEPQDRLIVHLQLVARGRVAQLGLVAQPFAQLHAQAVVVDLAPAKPSPRAADIAASAARTSSYASIVGSAKAIPMLAVRKNSTHRRG